MEAVKLAVKFVLFWLCCFGRRAAYLRVRALLAGLAAKLGIYERENLRLLSSFIKPGDTVVDAGAAYGIYTDALARTTGTTGTVLAFEPLSSTFHVLQHRESKSAQVKCFNLGLSSRAGGVSLKIPLLFGAIPEPALATFEHTSLKFEEVPAEITPLDAFIEDLEGLTFIKADIEGHERAFLEGALGTIRRYRPVIQIEENDPAGLAKYREFCRENDYRLFGLDVSGDLKEIERGAKFRGPNYYLLPGG